MQLTDVTLDGLDQTAKLELLHLLLNDLHRNGSVSTETMMSIASDVMLLEYREDQDLLCFDCMDHELEEE
ncbi:hypothetical protein [Neolewinella sp.]|uniref:hypothetical protein n=1 Tax=Neolewinella sp. TaxID=2993543 RepID=UPI003B5282F2